jgi:hypothetical protein
MATLTAASFIPIATELAGGTTFYWEVQALAPSGGGQNGAWSTVSSFTTAPGDFSLSVSPTTLTIAPGGSATSTLTMTPINNFSGLLGYSCSVSSSLAGVYCAVGILSGTSTLGVTVTASSSARNLPPLPRNPPFSGWWVAGVGMLCFLLIALSRMRQGRVQVQLWNLRSVALGAILAAILVASLSCGGGSSGGGGGSTPQPESGTVTVTGSSSTATHTATINVSVT